MANGQEHPARRQRLGGVVQRAAQFAQQGERAVIVIRTEAARLERLITDLINLARLDQRRFDIHPEPVDLGEIIHETATRHAARARSSR